MCLLVESKEVVDHRFPGGVALLWVGIPAGVIACVTLGLWLTDFLTGQAAYGGLVTLLLACGRSSGDFHFKHVEADHAALKTASKAKVKEDKATANAAAKVAARTAKDTAKATAKVTAKAIKDAAKADMAAAKAEARALKTASRTADLAAAESAAKILASAYAQDRIQIVAQLAEILARLPPQQVGSRLYCPQQEVKS